VSGDLAGEARRAKAEVIFIIPDTWKLSYGQSGTSIEATEGSGSRMGRLAGCQEGLNA